MGLVSGGDIVRTGVEDQACGHCWVGCCKGPGVAGRGVAAHTLGPTHARTRFSGLPRHSSQSPSIRAAVAGASRPPTWSTCTIRVASTQTLQSTVITAPPEQSCGGSLPPSHHLMAAKFDRRTLETMRRADLQKLCKVRPPSPPHPLFRLRAHDVPRRTVASEQT